MARVPQLVILASYYTLMAVVCAPVMPTARALTNPYSILFYFNTLFILLVDWHVTWIWWYLWILYGNGWMRRCSDRANVSKERENVRERERVGRDTSRSTLHQLSDCIHFCLKILFDLLRKIRRGFVAVTRRKLSRLVSFLLILVQLCVSYSKILFKGKQRTGRS